MNIVEIARLIIRKRRLLAAVIAVVLTVTLFICYFAPQYFTSSFVILPNPGASLGQGASLGLSAISGGELARFTGLNAILPKIIENDMFLLDVAGRRVNVWTKKGLEQISLADLLGNSDQGRIIRFAKQRITAELNKMNGCLKVSVSTPYPEMSYKVACYVLNKLEDHFTKQRNELKRINEAYYSSRIAEAFNVLSYAEENLSVFLGRNRGWEDSDHPEEKLELERLKRKQNICVGVYLNLQKRREIEDNKIREIIPPLATIDYPEIPLLKSAPKRKLIMLKGMMVTGLLLVLVLVSSAQKDRLLGEARPF